MISVLAPFRETGDGWRTKVWGWVRARLEEDLPGIEIIECTDDGVDPFNKCMAVNRGAEVATGDVLYILDTDCYCPGRSVVAAYERLDRNDWARPWRRKLKLGERATVAIISTGLSAWDRKADPPEHINSFWCSPPLMLSRSTFEDVGGMDERYRGWGGEDTAFGRALWKSGHGFASNGADDCIHLWHPRLGDYGRDRWAGQESTKSNEHLDREYNAAHSREQIRALIARR